MIKLLTKREMELFNPGIVMMSRYEREMGTPQPKENLAKLFVSQLSFKIDEDDIADVCEHLKIKNHNKIIFCDFEDSGV